MTAILLVVAAFAGDVREVEAGTWCSRGERLGGASVSRVEVHPEFERCWLTAEDGAMVAEIVPSDGVHEGQCEGGGHTLFPRPELVEGAVGRIPLEPLCARLQATPTATPLPLLPIALAVAGLLSLGGAGWLLRRRAGTAFAQILLGLLVPLTTTPAALFDGGGAGWEKLRVGLGLARDAGWGPGYALWMRPAVALLGARPVAVFSTNLVFAALWPAFIGAIGERIGGRRVGWGAAAAAALLPLHNTMARSEAMHVSAVTWGTLAVFGAIVACAETGAQAAIGAGVAGMAAVAATATRGDLGVVLPVIAAAGVFGPTPRVRLRGAGIATVAGALSLPWLHTESGALVPGSSVTATRLFSALLPHFGPLAPSGGYLASLHASLTPPVWWALAVAAILLAPRRPVLFAVAWAAVAGLPFLLKVEPAPDALRLQAFAQGGLVLLLGLAFSRASWAAAVLLLVGVATGPSLRGPTWLHREEWRFFIELSERLPSGSVVRLDPGRPHGDAAAEVLSTAGGVRWTADPAARVDWEYRGAAPLASAAEEGPVQTGLAPTRACLATDVDGEPALRRWRLELHPVSP